MSVPAPVSEPYVEPCLRCGAVMDWRHQTWQCPRCRFKLGCCEGASPEDCYGSDTNVARNPLADGVSSR